MRIFNIYIIWIYVYFSMLLFEVKKYYNYNHLNCLSLIIPSTEPDFIKCYKQFFYNYYSFSTAKEVIIVISSVTNTKLIRRIINNLTVKKKIVLGLRNRDHNAASNRNFGFSLSKCNIISYFDMDDIMLNNRLSILYNLFTVDKTTEFVLHKYTTKCNSLAYTSNNKKSTIYKFNLSYSYIFNIYNSKYKLEKSTNRWCCKHMSLISSELIHNGWPTMRRYIMDNVKYNISYMFGQDSDFNSNVILNRYNTTILNISLGYYKKDNECINYKSCYLYNLI